MTANPPPLNLAVAGEARVAAPSRPASPSSRVAGRPIQPIVSVPSQEIATIFPGPDATLKGAEPVKQTERMLLELADGSAYEGYSFGAEKSITGECVFQTGVYSEALRPR